MTLLGASKLMSFVVLLAILLLLMPSTLGSASQPSIILGRKLFQYPGGRGYGYADGESIYKKYPGGGGYRKRP
ncbi:hypothetical protein GLYMA_06G134767v4 [Glycine max]|uniref:Uncharacterized protein n=1 Tax=Glycine soja TaxID=3848 RepID=A0A445K968_GLYSO|nr:hypothetical protein GLYMA_06G134767v4 [Glycine max]KAH1125721.1 hypothetical protein GYH30_015004 [Glycine max]RZC07341.1 hypothetical protein D0Y65_014603 [Glycine soja]